MCHVEQDPSQPKATPATEARGAEAISGTLLFSLINLATIFSPLEIEEVPFFPHMGPIWGSGESDIG